MQRETPRPSNEAALGQGIAEIASSLPRVQELIINNNEVVGQGEPTGSEAEIEARAATEATVSYPRAYQMEMLEHSLQRNVIVVVGHLFACNLSLIRSNRFN